MTNRTVYRVGPDSFETDFGRLQRNTERYDEGKGLIGGDPRRRPRWQHPLPPPPAQSFRLLSSDAATLSQMQASLGEGEIEVEIGSGRGEFILDWAAHHPQRRFLAFEVKLKLMRNITQRAARASLRNLWVSDDDARFDLPRLLPPQSVSVIHILFPDPWWKPKHQARRLFVTPFVDTLSDLLKPGGILRVATDVPGYGDAILALMSARADFLSHDPELSLQFQAAAPTSRQAYCDEVGRSYQYFYFTRNS
ncbi:MAG: hypothetical protein J5I90_15415 [Caldilineales bacterium]|nr:hypothetical protein [Caldilineales bacterium]